MLDRLRRPPVSGQEKLNAAQVAAVMGGIYRRGDAIIIRFLLFHIVLALGLGFVYSTWQITLTVCLAAPLIFLVSAGLLPRTFLTRCLAGVSLQMFVALHIYQMHGLAEMHFFFFTACTLMIVYQDWVCLWPGTLFIVAQHILFAALTNSGVNLYFFEQPYIGAAKLAFHFGIIAAQVVICGCWAYLLRKRTLEQMHQARSERVLKKSAFWCLTTFFCINGGWRFRSHARFQTSKFQPSIGNFDFFNTL